MQRLQIIMLRGRTDERFEPDLVGSKLQNAFENTGQCLNEVARRSHVDLVPKVGQNPALDVNGRRAYC